MSAAISVSDLLQPGHVARTWEEVAPTAQDVVDLLALDRITDPVVLEEARAYARSRIYEAARNGHDPAPAVREWDRVICAVSRRMVPVEAEAPEVPQ